MRGLLPFGDKNVAVIKVGRKSVYLAAILGAVLSVAAAHPGRQEPSRFVTPGPTAATTTLTQADATPQGQVDDRSQLEREIRANIVAIVERVPAPSSTGLPSEVRANVRLTSPIPVFVDQTIPADGVSAWSALGRDQQAQYGKTVLSAIHEAYPTLSPQPPFRELSFQIVFWIEGGEELEEPSPSLNSAAVSRYCVSRSAGWDCYYPDLVVTFRSPPERYTYQSIDDYPEETGHHVPER